MSTTPLGARTHIVLTSLLILSATLLAACGGEDDPSPAPTSSPSSSASTDPTGSPSPSDSVTPAAGKTVETSYFTTSVPKGWRVNVTSEDFSILAYDPETGDQIAFYVVPMYGNAISLDRLARTSVRTGPWSTKPTIEAESTLAGEPAYHVTGQVSGDRRGDNLGAVYEDNDIGVIFQVTGSDARLRELEESVLAAWQWR